MINTLKKNNLFLLLLMILFSNFSPAFTDEDSKTTGTLIVTYQTGQKGERLERIRFRLKSENTEPELYPKGANYADDSNFPARTIVIENLEPGKYTLQFLVPNKDAFFDDVNPRELLITRGETLKIDQKIKPKRSIK